MLKIPNNENLLTVARNIGTTVIAEDNKHYYFIPYWMTRTEDGSIQCMRFDQMPQELQDTIVRMRTAKPESDLFAQARKHPETKNRI